MFVVHMSIWDILGLGAGVVGLMLYGLFAWKANRR
jgi:hypothetical protein